jgi:diguanylate cyclase (GGDEF)-like protein
VAAGYALVAATWIVGSGLATGEPLIGVSIAKGLGFVAVTGTGLGLALGRRDRAIATARDREAAASAELRELALRDALTGLPNRASLHDRLEQALHRRRVAPAALAVLLIDLDDFKRVNDSLGHSAGDLVLLEFAARIRAATRAGDMVARIGGDSFVFVCDDVPDGHDARSLGERALALLEEPFDLGADSATLTASVGVALLGDGEADPETLLREADTAMHHAKSLGPNRIAVFHEELSRDAVTRHRLGSELRAALRRDDELVLHYQPIVDLATGEAVAFEALVRWQHPGLGLLPPAEFVPLAERSGLIRKLGEVVLHRACSDAAAASPRLAVNVNVSPAQLLDAGLPGRITDILAATRLPPTLLGLELTETLLLERADDAEVQLGALRALGVRLLMDDFGTGYASMRYLRRFPFTHLKLDRSYVHGLGVSAGDESIVAAAIAIGRAFSMTVVAEGIERPDQAAALAARGCAYGQGFHFARPQPLAAALAYPRRAYDASAVTAG